jgi:hypothetical protein
MVFGLFREKAAPFLTFYAVLDRRRLTHDDILNPIREDDFNSNHGFGYGDDSFRQHSFWLFDCIESIAAFLGEKLAMDSKHPLLFYLHIWLSFESKTPI